MIIKMENHLIVQQWRIGGINYSYSGILGVKNQVVKNIYSPVGRGYKLLGTFWPHSYKFFKCVNV